MQHQQQVLAGTVPGVLFALREKLQPTREEMIEFLFTAGAFGMVVANNACISGAAGGCQAEVGSASGMAAAAAVEMAGGTQDQAATDGNFIKEHAWFSV